MDLIVCGDALWISCGTWISFWSGLVGAAVSAVLAAAVAVGVVYATNHHQTTLVERQLKAADKAAEDALARQKIDQVKAQREQREALDKQLSEQREGLQLQLDEQRREASLAREHAAIADVMTHLFELRLNPPRAKDETTAVLAGTTSAVARWYIESSDKALRQEISKWQPYLAGLILYRRRGASLGLSNDEVLDNFATYVGRMISVPRLWTSAKPDIQGRLLAAVAKDRRTVKDVLGIAD